MDECMKEIMEIVKKYDQAAAVVIISKEGSVNQCHLPTWGALSLMHENVVVKRIDNDESIRLAAHIAAEMHDFGTNIVDLWGVLIKDMTKCIRSRQLTRI